MTLSAEDRQQLIEMYEAGYAEVLRALAGISVSELDAREGPGEWSPREVIHHLGDSEMDGAIRIRMLIAEQEPVLTGWDQERWTEVLYSRERPIEASLDAFRAARGATLPLLRLLTPTQWLHAGTHTQFGAMSANDWLTFYGTHAQDHARQIRRARDVVQTQADWS